MRSRSATVVALILPLMAAAAPAATNDLERLMQLLAARRHGHVAYTEVQHLGVLKRPLESSGELFYDAPDRLEKRVLTPKPQTLLLTHGTLIATRGHHTHRLELSSYPQIAPLIESLRATLAGDRTALERIFSVRFEGDLGHWSLVLAPRDAAAARTVREVRITGERDALKSVAILQPDGDRSDLTLGPELPR